VSKKKEKKRSRFTLFHPVDHQLMVTQHFLKIASGFARGYEKTAQNAAE